MNRFKNYGLWVSIFSFIPMLAEVFGWRLPINYSEIVNVVLAVLVLLGIISNPTQGKWYSDN